MAKVQIYTRSFNGGEVSPSMYGRIDDGKYQTGLALCRNFLIEPQGPVRRRPGFAYVAAAKSQDAAPRLIPFNYSVTQTLVLEFGPHYIRFFTDGKPVLGPDGNPYEVASPYEADELFAIHYVQSNDVMTLVHVNHPPMELRRYALTTWKLEEIDFNARLPAPKNLTAKYSYGSRAVDPLVYDRAYCVTALTKDGLKESSRSASVKIRCNPYATGANITLTWEPVEGAELYRVYRNNGGVWAYIGQTTDLSINDDNISPDGSITPPFYDDPFAAPGGIVQVKVTAPGIHYRTGPLASTDWKGDRQIAGYADKKVTLPFFLPNKTKAQLQSQIRDLTFTAGSGGSVRTEGRDMKGYNDPSDAEYLAGLIADGILDDWSDEDLQMAQKLPGCLITSIEIVSPGQHYETPVADIYADWDGGPIHFEPGDKGEDLYWEFPLSVRQVRYDVRIKDSTGSGCTFDVVESAEVGEAIDAINVVNPGKDYTKPEVIVTTSWTNPSGVDQGPVSDVKAEAVLGIVAVKVQDGGSGYPSATGHGDGVGYIETGTCGNDYTRDNPPPVDKQVLEWTSSLIANQQVDVAGKTRCWDLPIFVYDPQASHLSEMYWEVADAEGNVITGSPAFAATVTTEAGSVVSGGTTYQGYFITGINITEPGAGFAAANRVRLYVKERSITATTFMFSRCTFMKLGGKLALKVIDSKGTGADLSANVDSSGVITSVTVNKPGEGYVAPTVTVEATSGSGAVLKPSLGIVKINVTNHGSKQIGAPLDAILTDQGKQIPQDQAAVSVTLPITVKRSGSKVSWGVIDKNALTGTPSSGGECSVTITKGDNQYQITGMSVTKPGRYYVQPFLWIRDKAPAKVTLPVNINPDPATATVTDPKGSGAELQPLVGLSGGVLSVSVLASGSKYTNPVVTITHVTGTGAKAEAITDDGVRYPGAVTYFEQRRWFGGSLLQPSNLWASRPGTESDFSYRLPSRDDDRIAVRVAAREANRIQHLVPLAQLMLLTGAAEWRVSPLNSDAITPQSMSVRPQSYVGANAVQPLVINSNLLYVAERGGHLRELGYNYQAGGYITGDICLRTPHLFDGLDVTDLSYSKSPWPIVWGVSTSGTLLALTYVPEQDIGAFSEVVIDGAIESCCSVAEGEEDAVYVVTRRKIHGKTQRFIERMDQLRYVSLSANSYLDCFGIYEGEPKSEITGLTWLEGETVTIVADGGVEAPQVVKNGTITLQEPASVVNVGLLYTSDLQTLPLALQLQDGSFGAGHQKNLRSALLRVESSSGILAGPTPTSLTMYEPRGQETAGTPPTPTSGLAEVQLLPQWDAEGQLYIRQDQPLPLRIVSLTTAVEIV